MTLRNLVPLLPALLIIACATPTAGARLTEANWKIRDQVQFDHECPPEKVTVLRHDGSGTTVDLNVCGSVRRYKAFGTGQPGDAVTWLDVTSLYPSSTLLAPRQAK